MSNEELQKSIQSYRRQVDEVAATGYYRDSRIALQYVAEKLVRDSWPWVRADVDATRKRRLSVRDCALGATESEALIVHLFGSAVHGHRPVRRNAPRIRSFAGFTKVGYEDDGEANDCFPAIAKNDIAKLIGRSRSTVDKAIDGLRKGAGLMRTLSLVTPLYVPTGIMLDLVRASQMEFSFHVSQYAFASVHARSTALAPQETINLQVQHCSKAVADLEGARFPAANDGLEVKKAV